MCRWLRDILFPLEILGRKRKSIKFDLTTTPTQGSGRNTYKEITFKWSGDRLILSYVIFSNYFYPVSTEYENKKSVYVNGDENTISFRIPYTQDPRVVRGAIDDVIYFNCTNVTYLEINGERYI